MSAVLAPYTLPDGVTDLDHFGVRRDRVGGVIREYRLGA
jgi:hypothetical protein